MRKFAFISIIYIFCVCVAVHGYTNKNTLAVLDFENNSIMNADNFAALSGGLADILITEMNQVDAIQVVERRKLKSIIDEIKLRQSGVLDENAGMKVGAMLGAQNLVFGSYMVTMDNKIRIDVRIVEVETGLTIKASEVTGKTKNILKLVKKLAQKIIEDLKYPISKDEKKYFKKTKDFSLKTMVLFSNGLKYEDQGDFVKAKIYYLKALEAEPEFRRAKEKLAQLN